MTDPAISGAHIRGLSEDFIVRIAKAFFHTGALERPRNGLISGDPLTRFGGTVLTTT